MSLTESQRRDGIQGAARELYDAQRRAGLQPKFDDCASRVRKAVVAGDLKRQEK